MKIEEVKRNLNKRVKYNGNTERYKLTACILRGNQGGFYYQAELLDTVHGASVIICRLEEVEGL